MTDPLTGQTDLVRRLAGTLARASGWMKLVAVLAIVAGALYVLTIVGIVVAWIPIWLGVLLWQAADAASRAEADSDPVLLERALDRLRLLFTVYGVIALVGIVLAALAFVLLLVGVVGGLGELARELQGT